MSKHRQYPVRIPRYATGIRMQEQRLGFATGWWAERWQQTIEAMGFLGRFGRARKYAMGGQIVELEVGALGDRVIPPAGRAVSMKPPQGVSAKVVGTRKDPYEVTISFRQPLGAARERIIAALKAKPILIARMLANDLPVEVEEIFKTNGCDLLPGGKLGEGVYDMTTKCTCPDYANPCKHTLGVLILLGEEIANRPMLLLKLRGIEIEELANES